MSAPIVECGTCGNRFPSTHPAGGGVCPQCREVVAPPESAAPAACPRCGAAVEPGAAACGACGELLGGFGAGLPDGEDGGGAGDGTLRAVWAAAWRDWKDHLGTLLGGWLLAGLAGAVLATVLFFGGVLLASGAVAAVGEPERAWAPVAGVGLATYLAILAVVCWLLCGLTRLHLDAARAGTDEAPRGPDLGRLFAGDGFPRAFLAAATVGTFVLLLVCGPQIVVIGVAFGFGFVGVGGGPADWAAVALLITGYVLPPLAAAAAFCLFWPVPFLAADRPGLGHVRPVLACFTLPAGRWGAHVAVGLAAFGLLLAGGTAVCAGVLFTAPLAGLVLAHGYRGLVAGEAVADDADGLPPV